MALFPHKSPSPRALLALSLAGVLVVLALLLLWMFAEVRLRPTSPAGPSAPPALADLGVALFPESTPLERARGHAWQVAGALPPRHQVGYGLGEALATQLGQAHEAYGRRLGFRVLSPGRMSFRAPPGCRADLRCVYAELMRTNAAPVRALGERFLTHIRDRGLDAAQATELIVGFVQHIHYEVPQEAPFGILPPALVPALDKGDCDSKAVLAVMLLRQAGIDATVLQSDELAHAAVGVGLPGPGTVLHLDGRPYRYAEVSNKGWPVGMLPPRYATLRLWRVLPLPEAAGPEGGGPG